MSQSTDPPIGSSGSSCRIPWQAVFAGATYLILAFSVFGLSTSLDGGQMSGSHTPDQAQQIWFLEWARFAIAHGKNPFFSTLMNQPVGINLSSNTSMLGLGLVVSPMTALLGAVETWNVLLRLALFASATSMCLVLRRWVSWWPAAFVGGLLYGFSAYELMWANGYLFFAFVPLPPLMFLLLHELLARQQMRPLRAGALLGAVVGIQYLISSEVMATTALLMAVASLLYFIRNRTVLHEKWPYIKAGLLSMCATAILLTGYPIAFAYFGPATIHGFSSVQGVPDDFLGLIIPGPRMLIASGISLWSDPTSYFYSAQLYLGAPFIAVVVLTVICLRHRGPVLFAGCMAGTSLVLSLGATLKVDGRTTGIPLPFALISHLPLLGNIVAGRLSVFTTMFGAAVVAMGLDEVHRRVSPTGNGSSLRFGRADVNRIVATIALLAVIIISLMPSGAIATLPTPVSPYFTSSAVKAIPSGSLVLTYPYPGAFVHEVMGRAFVPTLGDLSVDDALLDQSVTGMRFGLIGGYGWMPPRSNSGLPDPTPLPPRSVREVFDLAFYGLPISSPTLRGNRIVLDLRTFLRKYKVGTVVVLPLGVDPQAIVAEVTAAIGPPVRSGGVTLWLRVQDRLSSRE